MSHQKQVLKAFTVNVPSENFLKEVDYFGTVSGRNADKLVETGLISIKSDLVDAPFVKEFPIEKIYGKLSKDWIHTKGFADRILDEESNIPQHESTKSILVGIDDLLKRISQFRTILKAAMEKYTQSCIIEKHR